jgi:hypothetical protein
MARWRKLVAETMGDTSASSQSSASSVPAASSEPAVVRPLRQLQHAASHRITMVRRPTPFARGGQPAADVLQWQGSASPGSSAAALHRAPVQPPGFLAEETQEGEAAATGGGGPMGAGALVKPRPLLQRSASWQPRSVVHTGGSVVPPAAMMPVALAVSSLPPEVGVELEITALSEMRRRLEERRANAGQQGTPVTAASHPLQPHVAPSVAAAERELAVLTEMRRLRTLRDAASSHLSPRLHQAPASVPPRQPAALSGRPAEIGPLASVRLRPIVPGMPAMAAAEREFAALAEMRQLLEAKQALVESAGLAVQGAPLTSAARSGRAAAPASDALTRDGGELSAAVSAGMGLPVTSGEQRHHRNVTQRATSMLGAPSTLAAAPRLLARSMHTITGPGPGHWHPPRSNSPTRELAAPLSPSRHAASGMAPSSAWAAFAQAPGGSANAPPNPMAAGGGAPWEPDATVSLHPPAHVPRADDALHTSTRLSPLPASTRRMIAWT